MSSVALHLHLKSRSFCHKSAQEHLQLMFAGIASVDKSPSPFQHQTQILIYKAEIIIKSQMRAIALKLSC